MLGGKQPLRTSSPSRSREAPWSFGHRRNNPPCAEMSGQQYGHVLNRALTGNHRREMDEESGLNLDKSSGKYFGQGKCDFRSELHDRPQMVCR